MQEVDFFIKNLWRRSVGLSELSPEPRPTLKDIYEKQWSKEFETYMRNRLAMGYFRYGSLERQSKGQYDNIGSILKRLTLYKKTGNDEILVDVANLAMVEYMLGNHPLKHFKAEDGGIHTEKAGVT